MSAPSAETLARLRSLVAAPEFVRDPSSRETRTINEVFTGEPLAEMMIGTSADIDAAADRASVAQREWAARPVAERARILAKFGVLVHENREFLLDVVQAETGKARSSALEEVLDVSMTASYYAKLAPKELGRKSAKGMIPVLTKTEINHLPKGIVGVISPWNYPLTLAVSDAVPAMIAGNAIVLKPDSQTPFSALAAAELLYRAGVPRDLFAVVPGPGREIGTAILDNSDYLMFTGSTATGRKLAAQAGERLINFSAELGGKNPMVVTADADVDEVAEIATRAMFSNAGQLCISIERVYVERGIADKLEKALVRRIGEMKVGPGYEFDKEMGSLISADQFSTVQKHVDDAVAKGARVLVGGKARPDLGPLFFEPTLLADVPEEAECFAGETFGPLVSLYPVDTVDEAIEKANDTEYGLNASVFAGSDQKGVEIARRIHAGTVNVGEGYVAAWGSYGAPMGGMGVSGVGRRHGVDGLLKYTEAQTVATQRLMHLGGPDFMDTHKWNPTLGSLAGTLRFLPGR